MNVLVIAPHPDDESIGCGGTISLHAERGNRVTVVFLTSGEHGLQKLPEEKARRVREREAEKAAAILGIASVTFLSLPNGHVGDHVGKAAEALRPILKREEPEVIYLTHGCDRHPDHRAARPIVQAALEGSGIPVPTLLSYEVLTFLPSYDHLEDITPMMQRKLEAVRAHRSQVRQFRYDRAARALNEYRGIVAEAARYAEVFQYADGRVSAISEERRADPAWYRVYSLTQEIVRLVPASDAFILVDDGGLQAAPLVAPRRCIPFLEKDGCYWGRPPDDATAIQEIERLRKAGARFMVFAGTALWWLDHYATMHQYLRTQFRCVLEDAQLAIFELRECANLRKGL